MEGAIIKAVATSPAEPDSLFDFSITTIIYIKLFGIFRQHSINKSFQLAK